MVDNNSYYALLQDAHVQYPNVRVDLFERLLCDRLNWTKTDYILRVQDDVLPEHREQFKEDVTRLVAGEPLQYIIGCEWFYGRCFTVNPYVLIPRPETELLVETVLRFVGNDTHSLQILDVGTGSGAIGITLALEQTNWSVTLLDISQDALNVARLNALQLGAQVTVIQSDVLDDVTQSFDVIVSNPPYISELEKSLMDESVLRYEPHLALFARQNGLAIYDKLLQQAQCRLADNGLIVLEIGFQQSAAVTQLAKRYFPKKDVQTIKDYSGLDRIIVIR